MLSGNAGHYEYCLNFLLCILGGYGAYHDKGGKNFTLYHLFNRIFRKSIHEEAYGLGRNIIFQKSFFITRTGESKNRPCRGIISTHIYVICPRKGLKEVLKPFAF